MPHPQHKNTALTSMILAEWQRDVPDAVSMAARTIADMYGDTVSAVIFYGSCLRTGEIEDKILDFYVIVDSYLDAYDKRWLAVGNKILPPNVFYHEMDVDGMTIRSKYAVLSSKDFSYRVSQGCLNVSVWARFCQPCMVLNARSEAIENYLARDVATAVVTMLNAVKMLLPNNVDSKSIWVSAFEHTYAAELRSEPTGKGLEIYELDKERYDKLSPAIFPILGVDTRSKNLDHRPYAWPRHKSNFKWFARRWNGKVVSFLRLIKASITFDGGIDYLAWKISRHSGVQVEVKDWMRKHPILAGISLFFSMRKKGAFK